MMTLGIYDGLCICQLLHQYGFSSLFQNESDQQMIIFQMKPILATNQRVIFYGLSHFGQQDKVFCLIRQSLHMLKAGLQSYGGAVQTLTLGS